MHSHKELVQCTLRILSRSCQRFIFISDKGAIIFYEEGGRLFVGGTRIFLGNLRGEPEFFTAVKGRGPEKNGDSSSQINGPPIPAKNGTSPKDCKQAETP